MLSHSFKAHLVINQTMIESGLSLSLSHSSEVSEKNEIMF